MIAAERFISAATARGFGLYTGVPCSYLTPFINHVINADGLRYVGAANEGDAVAIAAGAELGGLRGIVMFQNSGLGNAVNPLTSLTWTFRIPMLLIVTWRGEPAGAADEPQHALMGQITPSMLELMGIPWSLFPAEEDGIGPVLERACNHMEREGRPYALVMRKGSVADTTLDANSAPVHARRTGACKVAQAQATRRVMLNAIQMALKPDDVVVATTGYMGRELFALDDRPCQFYMVGSMGCAVSVGLGLAIARPDKRIIVIDGDGAALMRLGALTTVAQERPANLLHLLLDNGMHESTGGQATVSRNVDFCALAAAGGYTDVTAASDPGELCDCVDARAPGLRFVHVPVKPGAPTGLPRPTMRPEEVAARLRQHLGPVPG